MNNFMKMVRVLTDIVVLAVFSIELKEKIKQQKAENGGTSKAPNE